MPFNYDKLRRKHHQRHDILHIPAAIRRTNHWLRSTWEGLWFDRTIPNIPLVKV